MTNKTTLFKAIDSCDHFSIDGCVPTFVDKDDPEVIELVFGEGSPTFELRDQTIEVDKNGKVWIGITNTDTDEELEQEIIFFQPVSFEYIVAGDLSIDAIEYRGYYFSAQDKTLQVKIPNSDKFFTITDMGEKVEIKTSTSENHSSCLTVYKHD